MNSAPIASVRSRAERRKWLIEFVGFWLLSLCNNFGYVVMLSAAHDILKQEGNDSTTQPVSHNTTNRFDCNPTSTGAILLADILPALIIKVTAPLFMHKISYNIRFALIVIFAVSALVIVGLSKVVAFSLFGIACASISSGFGEITMLQLTSFYPKHTVSAWPSGTGAAALLGALSFAALTAPLKVNPRTAILILIFISVLQVFGVWVVKSLTITVGKRPFTSMYVSRGGRKRLYMLRYGDSRCRKLSFRSKYDRVTALFLTFTISDATTTDADTDNDTEEKITVNKTTTVTKFMSKLQLVKPLLKYMIPLSLVYFAEYLINQGL
ncbi:unnamed protein product, partial [Rotaria magnacalcarata]